MQFVNTSIPEDILPVLHPYVATQYIASGKSSTSLVPTGELYNNNSYISAVNLTDLYSHIVASVEFDESITATRPTLYGNYLIGATTFIRASLAEHDELTDLLYTCFKSAVEGDPYHAHVALQGFQLLTRICLERALAITGKPNDMRITPYVL